jgi:hypothetical protein
MTRQEQRNSRINSMVDDNPALIFGLQAAVPLWILELTALPEVERDARIRTWARVGADEGGSKGDVLQYGSKRRGEAAAVFNHLARGLAAAAYQPGGVTWAGQHWCTDHAVCEGAEAEVAARRATPVEPGPDDEPDDDAGEWYGTRRVESIQPAGEFL